MAKIAILKKDKFDFQPFEEEQYVIDTSREFGGYESGDIICSVQPFFGVPVTLSIAIRKNGELIFRSWSFGGVGNHYLHTYISESGKDEIIGKVTQEQRDTVSGLFSGRIKFEGLKLSPGGTLQEICPIDLKKEETLTGKKIYLNMIACNGEVIGE